MAVMSIAQAITERARRCPDDVVVTAGLTEVTAAQLDSRSNRLARAMVDAGVCHDDTVAVAMGNGIPFVVTCAAIWKAGATPLLLDPDLPTGERAELERLGSPALAVGMEPVTGITWMDTESAVTQRFSDAPLSDRPASCWKAPTSSGSTGRPKIVRASAPAMVDPEQPVAVFLPNDAVQLVTAPLWHSAAFTYAFRGLTAGHRLVVEPRFDEHRFGALVAEHGITWTLLSPSTIRRLLRLGPDRPDPAEMAVLETILHIGARCPAADKRALIDWLGPERVVEVYAGTESNGLTMITGAEWLAHPGSVGRPIGGTEISIRDDAGHELGPGRAGLVWMRRGGMATYDYRGAASRRTADGWDTLGDVGTVDADGYLTILDRAGDVIECGSGVVYPADVEQVVESHPLVRDAVVTGRCDEGSSTAPHPEITVVVDVGDADVDPDEILRYAAGRLEHRARPTSITIARRPLRNGAGKTRRSAYRPTGRPRPTSRSEVTIHDAVHRHPAPSE
ncbi:AMP-binding protein [Gordonia soli]|uniref:Putative fatty-acid--CoA ligase n=1 Tax=Gordonia soli NBRC 108243 TaxID=1223545 RepID=M0QF97_9ACTN|nr:AMP-binding protein [Gordonia soli]GAC66971.1 putative fatty-acid--CoA ligase [Gordonia soli NBRC 108243]